MLTIAAVPLSLIFWFLADTPIAIKPRQPIAIRQSILVASADQTDQRYLAFPAILDLGDEALVSFKRGRSHAQDTGATLDLLRLDPRTGRVAEHRTLAALDGHILQMGEWVRFPNGDIASYIDTQVAGKSTTRVGLHVVRSTDGGRTFGPLAKVGAINGVEYGYAFEAITEGPTTWLLAMTFANLPGGKSVYPPRPHAGAVHVIRTDDNGRTWKFVRDLSHEFGDVPINESTFLRHGDGFLVSTRGYDDRQRLLLIDGNFSLIRQTDLTATHDFIASHLGRPRLFARDGGVYLLGRNWTKSPRAMQLGLFRIDPAALTAVTHVVLDNAERANIADGYYAMPYFRGEGADTRMFVVDYKRPAGQTGPDIVLREFRWDDVK
ncbi:MAG TPA: sialidase family protein [Planctomycetaceae bacterium]|nr:sialidase family protein [Planctomycetaceae bacterium]